MAEEALSTNDAKFVRLMNLTAALQAAGMPLTAEEIFSRVPNYDRSLQPESLRRTFERDKDDLRAIGVPIEVVEIGTEGAEVAAYRLAVDYELPEVDLSAEELAALRLAALTVDVRGIPEEEVDDALAKLGAGVGRDRGDAAAGPGPIIRVEVPEQLPELFRAVAERRVVGFRHGGTERRLRPHRVQFERGHWYVNGHDLDRDAPRSFRLDRLEGSVTVTDETFDVPTEVGGVRLRAWEFGAGEPTAATVLLDPAAARSVLAEDPDLGAHAERLTDGRVRLHLEVRDPVGLRTFLLSFLDRAELESPPELRDGLVAWLSAVAAGEAP